MTPTNAATRQFLSTARWLANTVIACVALSIYFASDELVTSLRIAKRGGLQADSATREARAAIASVEGEAEVFTAISRSNLTETARYWETAFSNTLSEVRRDHNRVENRLAAISINVRQSSDILHKARVCLE